MTIPVSIYNSSEWITTRLTSSTIQLGNTTPTTLQHARMGTHSIFTFREKGAEMGSPVLMVVAQPHAKIMGLSRKKKSQVSLFVMNGAELTGFDRESQQIMA